MATRRRMQDGSERWRYPGAESGLDAWYRALVEKVPAVLYVDESDEESSAVYMSPQSETLLGYSQGEWLEDPGLWVKILHPEDRERVLDSHRHARRAGEPFEAEYRLVARDGSAVWVRDEAVLLEGEQRWPGQRAGVLSDVTDRKLYEERLRKSEERFRLVAKATGEAIWDNDLATGTQEWAGATEALFGYPHHEGGTGAWWEERVHPDDKERVLSGLDVLLEGDDEAWEEAYRFRRADGSYAEVVDRGHVVRDGRGRPVRMVGSMRDVTERKRREEELKRSEELFRRTFEDAAVGMAHLSPDGQWLMVNDRLCEISGYPREELLGMSYLEMTPPEDRGGSLDRVRRMLGSSLDSYSVERRYVRKDGSRVWVNLTVSLVRRPSGQPERLVCVAEDTTGRKLADLFPDPPTRRELEVLREIVAGRSNPEIADLLPYSVGTVKLCVRRIIAKLDVRDRAGAASRAVETGLLPPARQRA